MQRNGTARPLLWLTLAAAVVAGVAAFVALYRLRGDPQPGLGAAYETAAFLQPLPFVVAAAVAVWFRRRPAVLACLLAAVVGCGAYGAWWLGGLEEVRQVENQPTRRNALGNIAPDIEGQVGAAEAFGWPAVAAGLISGAALVGWLATRRPGREDRFAPAPAAA